MSLGMCGWGVENGKDVTEEIPRMLPKRGIEQCNGQPGQGVIVFLLLFQKNLTAINLLSTPPARI